MTVTAAYSHAHEAFLTVGRAHDLACFDMRLVVALAERGGVGRTDQLEVEMQSEGTAIRRSYPGLWDRGLLKVDAGEGTVRPKRGVRARLTLTDVGWELATRALARMREGTEMADAA